MDHIIVKFQWLRCTSFLWLSVESH